MSEQGVRIVYEWTIKELIEKFESLENKHQTAVYNLNPKNNFHDGKGVGYQLGKAHTYALVVEELKQLIEEK